MIYVVYAFCIAAFISTIVVEFLNHKEYRKKLQGQNESNNQSSSDKKCFENCSRVQFLEKVNEDNQAEIEYLRKALKEEQLRCSLMQQEMMKLRKK